MSSEASKTTPELSPNSRPEPTAAFARPAREPSHSAPLDGRVPLSEVQLAALQAAYLGILAHRHPALTWTIKQAA